MGLQAAFMGSTPISDSSSGVDMNLRTSHGYMVNEWAFLGIGVGVDIHKLKDVDAVTYVPLFLNGRVYLNQSRFAPYVDMKGGYAVADAKGGYLEPSLGLSCALGKGFALDVALTYEWVRVKYDVYAAGGYLAAFGSEHVSVGSLGFTVGLEF